MPDDASAFPTSPGQLVLFAQPHTDASAAAAKLVSGGRVIGITRGQFSLLDLLQALLDVTGPADVTIATWTAGIRDSESAAWLLSTGKIRRLQFLIDRSMPSRQPAYCGRMLELFGDDAIRIARVHAKFMIIRNAGWNICVRSSMNLNRNTRWEQYDIDDSAAICDHFATVMRAALDHTPPGWGATATELKAASAAWSAEHGDENTPDHAPPGPPPVRDELSEMLARLDSP